MIRIQKLKQPKTTSGKKVSCGETLKIDGLLIKNTNKQDVFVDTYERKSYAPKVSKKKMEKVVKAITKKGK